MVKGAELANSTCRNESNGSLIGMLLGRDNGRPSVRHDVRRSESA